MVTAPYRTRYLSVVRADLVLELLLTDEGNPRSVAFQLASLLHQIDRLQENDPSRGDRPERPLALQALNAVRNAQTAGLSIRHASRDGDERLAGLEDLLQEIQSTLSQLSDALMADYLTHLTSSRLTASL